MKQPEIPARGRLAAMLRRRGAVLPEPPDADLLAALARCEACRYTAMCEELLATPGSGGNRSFCANTGYVEALRQKGLAFAKA